MPKKMNLNVLEPRRDAQFSQEVLEQLRDAQFSQEFAKALVDKDVCHWVGGETVDVSEYAQDEFGEFYRMTSTENARCPNGMFYIPADETHDAFCIDEHPMTNEAYSGWEQVLASIFEFITLPLSKDVLGEPCDLDQSILGDK